MAILQIRHAVRNYDGWKRAFDSDPVGREEGGVRRHRILRATEDPNFVVIELEFGTTAEADAFAARLNELWGRVGDNLGLEGPEARVFELVETSEDGSATSGVELGG